LPSLFLLSIHQESLTTMERSRRQPEEKRRSFCVTSTADKAYIAMAEKEAAVGREKKEAKRAAAAAATAANPSGSQPVDDPMNGEDEKPSCSKSFNPQSSSGPSTFSSSSLPLASNGP
ncbi:hypothetical protein PFISCL1PPCAC_9456, partial [Pristionchus fissidentatus]